MGLIFYGISAFILYYVYLSVRYVIGRYFSNLKTEQKKESLQNKFKTLWKRFEYFTLPKEIEDQLITARTFRDIQGLLFTSKEVTCVSILNFYTKRSLQVGVKLNYVIEFMYEEALEMARNRDQELKKYSSAESLPPLFGIPVSIKDMLNVEGYDCTIGSSGNCFDPCTESGAYYHMLVKAGAVPFIKSNVPQLTLINETNNFILGRTIHP